MMNKMLFSLNVSTMESNHIFLFYHDGKTEEEFNNDVNNLIVNNIDNVLEKYKDTFITTSNLIGYISTKLPELGYNEAKVYSYNFEDCGLFSISNVIGTISNIIGIEMINKIEEHNLKIYNKF